MGFVAALALLPMAAFGVTVEPLSPSEYADTEASTNIPFEVSFDAMSRMNFSISLEASPSNCVEVSIGEDANGDGNLSPEESAYTFGCDCERWFERDAVGDTETNLPAAATRGVSGTVVNGQVEKSFVLKKRKLDETWNLVKVTRRGVAEIGEVVLVEGKKPGAALIVR